MKKQIFFIAALLIATTSLLAKTVTPAEQLPTYYSSVDGKGGAELFSQLTAVTNGGFHSLSYKEVWSAYATTDIDANGYILDMYSNCRFKYRVTQCGGDNYKKECDCYNREHSIPKSWFGQKKPSGIGCDVFHLVPTDGKVNAMRSNFAFGEVSSASYQYDGSKLGTPVSSIKNEKKTICSNAGTTTSCPSGKVFEPQDQYKGDFARGYLGTIMKWNNSVTITQGDGAKIFRSSYSVSSNFGLTPYGVALLMKWHREDPVSEKEIKRNNGIQQTQGNRNPFIDYPYLAEFIWGERAGDVVEMAKLICSSDPRFVPGKSDGWGGFAQGFEEISTTEPVARKIVVNGQIFIERDGHLYNIMGQKID